MSRPTTLYLKLFKVRRAIETKKIEPIQKDVMKDDRCHPSTCLTISVAMKTTTEPSALPICLPSCFDRLFCRNIKNLPSLACAKESLNREIPIMLEKVQFKSRFRRWYKQWTWQSQHCSFDIQ
jgi:hypothetical protein